MEIIKNVINNTSIITLLPILFTILSASLKLTIDNINMSGIEKKLLTNSKFFSIQFSIMSVIAIAYSLVFLCLMINNNSIKIDNYEDLLSSVATLIVITFIAILGVYIILNGTLFFIKTKIDYYIEIEENNVVTKWYLVRKINKKTILISSDGYKVYKFFDSTNINDLTFHSEPKKDYESQNSIYKFIHKNTWLLFVFVVLIVTFSLLVLYKGTAIKYMIPLYISTYVGIVVLLIQVQMSSLKLVTSSKGN